MTTTSKVSAAMRTAHTTAQVRASLPLFSYESCKKPAAPRNPGRRRAGCTHDHDRAREAPMARNTAVRTLDDLTGGRAAETVAFALDGVEYDIDLGARNAAALRRLLERYAKAGRRTGGRKLRPRLLAGAKKAEAKPAAEKPVAAGKGAKAVAGKKTAAAGTAKKTARTGGATGTARKAPAKSAAAKTTAKARSTSAAAAKPAPKATKAAAVKAPAAAKAKTATVKAPAAAKAKTATVKTAAPAKATAPAPAKPRRRAASAVPPVLFSASES
ncbi:predicted protein [Streptomyces sp. AA4]|nr:predicted protein [Streptomyces sp. AA4]